MAQSLGYLVDLTGVQFEEGTNASWIQAMPLGTYDHPMYGEIKITPERVVRFAENVNNKVRDTELDIDYDHKAKDGEAAGWVKNAEARSSGLYLLVEWTEDAATKIKKKAYKYFSPEFTDEWEHPKTKVKFHDVLFGGGLTNRPFLKDILPVNLSEAFESATLSEGGEGMSKLQELAKSLGLPEDASAEDVATAAAAKLAAPPVENKKEDKKEETAPDAAAIAASEAAAAELKKLSESNPAIKLLMEQQAETNRKLAETQTALKLSETEKAVMRFSEGPVQLSAAQQESLKGILLTSDDKTSAAVLSFAETVLKTGLVSTKELGESGSHGAADDAVKQFTEAIQKIQKDNEKMSFSDAVAVAAQRNPELYAAYRGQSYSGRE